MMIKKIAILAQDMRSQLIAEQLASTLDFPIIHQFSENYSWLLCINETGLSLQLTLQKNMNAIKVDFTDEKLNYRRLHGGGKNQAIAKAIGLTKNKNPVVLDATAGLGTDAFILASLGCSVTLVECSPIISALLQDGLNRGKNNAAITSIVSQMKLIVSDSITYMKALTEKEKPDIVYLDPMFPVRKKSAQVKKEMQYLQILLENQKDESSLLLNAALSCAKKRVVVKRPRLAEPLNDKKPDMKIIGKSCRFDVYLKI